MLTAVAGPHGVRASADAPVPWWSFGKTVLASAALALVASGRLPLDAALPGRPFSLRQLLQHRAGLPCYGGLAAYHAAVRRGDAPWTLAEMLRRTAEAPAPALGDWAYSNVGYALVRELIEQSMGAPLGPALEALVFAPLGLAGVALATGPADLAACAWGNADGYDPGWVYHGLLLGQAGTAALFLHRLLAGALLPPDLLAAMLVAHPVEGEQEERPWTVAGYGLGLMIGRDAAGGLYAGHTGGGPGSVSAVYRRMNAGPACTGAAFAPGAAPGPAEAQAMALSDGG